MKNPSAARLGHWAALALVGETSVFLVTLILGVAGVGTGMLAYFVCAFLPVSFITMLIAVEAGIPPEKRLWTRLAVSFAGVYAAFCTTAYFLQLAIVRNNPLGLSVDVIRLLVFKPGSATFAIDMLGYGFMCIAALAVIPAIDGADRDSRWLRWLLAIKGLMAVPTVVFPALLGPAVPGAIEPAYDYGSFALIGWCLVFIPIAALFAKRFRALGA